MPPEPLIAFFITVLIWAAALFFVLRPSAISGKRRRRSVADRASGTRPDSARRR